MRKSTRWLRYDLIKGIRFLELRMFHLVESFETARNSLKVNLGIAKAATPVRVPFAPSLLIRDFRVLTYSASRDSPAEPRSTAWMRCTLKPVSRLHGALPEHSSA